MNWKAHSLNYCELVKRVLYTGPRVGLVFSSHEITWKNSGVVLPY